MNPNGKSIRRILMLLFAFATLSAGSALGQTWTSANGKFKIDAAFVQVKEDRVQLKRVDNENVIWVNLKDLSERDQSRARRLQNELDAKSRLGKKAGGRVEELLQQVKLDCTVELSEAAQWNEDEDETGQPVVTLTATGPPAAAAMQYGKVTIEKFVDTDGKVIEQEAEEFSMTDISKEMAKIDRESDFYGVHPKDGVAIEIKIPAESAPREIAELSGSFSLLTGGTKTKAQFDGLSKQVRKSLKSHSLKKAGLKIQMEDILDDDQYFGLSFNVEGKLKMMNDIYIGDANGNKLDSQNGHSTSTFNNKANYSFFFSQDVTENAVLYVELVEGAVELTVPFKFANMKIPKPE